METRYESVGLDYIVHARRDELARRQRIATQGRWAERMILLAFLASCAAVVYAAASGAL